ncbi:hypothetical protein KC799_12790 [candidate division KSB1 bacterium]|nr:hypothetical protein [candidate division KSB1 bacterium]
MSQFENKYAFRLSGVIKRYGLIYKVMQLTLLTCTLFPSLSAQEIDTPLNNFQVRYFAFFMDTSKVIALPDSFILAETDSLVFHDTHLQRDLDYRINFSQSRLVLLTPNIQAGDSIFISYQKLNWPLRKTYFLQKPQTKPDSLSSSNSIATMFSRQESAETDEYTSNLRKSGSLVRGISLGSNQGLKVDSGLRLQVSGEVTEGVEIVAALTDQSTPIQPEGNTQTLQEIDKVFIKLKSRQFETTMGDYNLDLTGTEFTRYQRKLQGAMATVYPQNDAHVTFSGAVSKGQFRTQEFQGIEGNQGPYQLTGERGQIDILVLAGTERIWIDGEEMVRGENNDYVIEYGSGEITFTRKRLITADSRISVDFQFSDERFQRNLYALEAEAKLFDEKLAIKSTLLREKDDADNPLGITLTDEIRDALSSAGDGQAVSNGANYVGADSGSYILQDSIFIYVGIDQGDYQVRFSDLGPGQGSYEYEGFGRYRFIGQGAARYAPVVLLPTAKKHDVADLRMDFQTSAAIKVSTELAVSNLDNNLYSSLDDGDNTGQAWLLSLAAQPQSLTLHGINFGRADLHVHHRFRSERYKDIDRADEIEFGRQWDIADEKKTGNERITEAKIRYIPRDRMHFFGSGGFLNQDGNGISSKKISGGTRWQTPQFLELNYNIEKIEKKNETIATPNSWLRQNGAVFRTMWYLTPKIEFESETKKETPLADSLRSGFRFTQLASGVELARFKHIAAGIEYTQREDDDRFEQSFLPKSTAHTRQFNLATQNIKNFNFSGSYIHRTRDYNAAGLSDTRTDLAEINIGSSQWKNAVKFSSHYQITNTQVGKQEEVYFKVREGDGNYSYDAALDEYIPDPFGEYVLRLLPTDEFIPVVELKGRINVRLSPKTALRTTKTSSFYKKFLANISSETFLRIEEKTQEPKVRDIYFLNLSKFQNPDTTILGNMSLRQDITLFEMRRDISLRYRLLSSKSINNQFIDSKQKRRYIRHEWRLNAPPTRQWGGRFELIRTIEDKTFSSETRPDRFIRGLRFESEVSWRPQNRLEVALHNVYGFDADKAYKPQTEVRQMTLKPRTTYSFSGRGRLRAEFEYTKVTANEDSRIIPYEMAQGNRLGRSMRWNLSFDYRMSTNLNSSISYQGRDEPQRDQTIHVAKVEMRAYF